MTKNTSLCSPGEKTKVAMQAKDQKLLYLFFVTFRNIFDFYCLI